MTVYKKVNLAIAGVLLSIFMYSGFFAYTGFNHLMPSSHQFLTGQESISTGLSRSFSEIMKLNIHAAKALNPYGLRLFIFFLLQLLLRIFFAFSKSETYFETRQVVTVDCVVSAGLFVLFFEPFIKDFFFTL